MVGPLTGGKFCRFGARIGRRRPPSLVVVVTQAIPTLGPGPIAALVVVGGSPLL